MRKFLLLFLILSMSAAEGQVWPKIHTHYNRSIYASWTIETYDNGFLIFCSEFSQNYAWLIKVDVNGNKLWERWIRSGQSINGKTVVQTLDNGYIINGTTSKYDLTMYDPYMVKLDACGIVEWCTVINTPGKPDGSTRVRSLSNGNILLAVVGDQDNPDDILQLHKFDSNGNLLWSKAYNPDSLVMGAIALDVIEDDDGYLLTSRCYYPYPSGYERPFFIKTDTAGNIEWHLVYGSGNGYHGYPFDDVKISSSGNFYCFTVHSNICDKPAFVKVTPDGQESYYHDLLDSLCPGGNKGSILFANDTTIVTYFSGKVGSDSVSRYVHMDTLGNILFYQNHPNWIAYTNKAILTSDNKIFSIGSSGSALSLYLTKIRYNDLLFDSLNTFPYTYDSLCPGIQATDTLDFTCNLVMKINQLETKRTSFKIYPNPATDRITIELPEALTYSDHQAGVRSKSMIYSWDYLSLEIFDLSGKRVLDELIPKSQSKKIINTQNFPRGMYFIKLMYKNNLAGTAKILLN